MPTNRRDLQYPLSSVDLAVAKDLSASGGQLLRFPRCQVHSLQIVNQTLLGLGLAPTAEMVETIPHVAGYARVRVTECRLTPPYQRSMGVTGYWIVLNEFKESAYDMISHAYP